MTLPESLDLSLKSCVGSLTRALLKCRGICENDWSTRTSCMWCVHKGVLHGEGHFYISVNTDRKWPCCRENLHAAELTKIWPAAAGTWHTLGGGTSPMMFPAVSPRLTHTPMKRWDFCSPKGEWNPKITRRKATSFICKNPTALLSRSDFARWNEF